MAGDFGNIRHEGGMAFNSGKKPVKMIKRFLDYFENKDICVLDFFAGSGSTGHAVLALNKEDGGHRKFILCTNNQNNICEDITYNRIKNVIEGYAEHKSIKSKMKCIYAARKLASNIYKNRKPAFQYLLNNPG